MKAARLEDGELRLVTVDRPTPERDHALVRIRTAGVCHSDLHLVRGDWAGVGRTLPIGHEAIGVVEELGDGAQRWVRPGDRVILGLGGTGGGYWCGSCEYCLRGLPRHCPEAKGIMGTFAEHFSVYAPGLVVLPDSLGDREAPLACGGLTAYGAIRKLHRHGVEPGRWVAVIGAAGGLGHYAVQIAHAFGYRVLAVDVGAERLAFARELGAELVADPGEAVEVAASIGGVDASVVFAARVAGFQLGFDLLRRAGVLVAVGLPPSSDGSYELQPFAFFAKDPLVLYSAVGTVQEMRELVALAAAGKVTTHVSRTGTLEDLPQIFDELEAASYLGRAVVSLDPERPVEP